MIDVTKENIKCHILNWEQIPNHSYRLLIIGHSESRKANALLTLVKNT